MSRKQTIFIFASYELLILEHTYHRNIEEEK
jgi:hypothetical protein